MLLRPHRPPPQRRPPCRLYTCTRSSRSTYRPLLEGQQGLPWLPLLGPPRQCQHALSTARAGLAWSARWAGAPSRRRPQMPLLAVSARLQGMLPCRTPLPSRARCPLRRRRHRLGDSQAPLVSPPPCSSACRSTLMTLRPLMGPPMRTPLMRWETAAAAPPHTPLRSLRLRALASQGGQLLSGAVRWAQRVAPWPARCMLKGLGRGGRVMEGEAVGSSSSREARGRRRRRLPLLMTSCPRAPRQASPLHSTGRASGRPLCSSSLRSSRTTRGERGEGRGGLTGHRAFPAFPAPRSLPHCLTCTSLAASPA